MIAATNWTAIAGFTAPVVLAAATYLFSRRERRISTDSEASFKTVEAAVLSVDVMRGLLVPLQTELKEQEAEVAALRTEVKQCEQRMRSAMSVLRDHIMQLEQQLTGLGADPPPVPEVPPFGRGK